MKTIAIDFDGVIHKYSKGWQDGSIYDEPMEEAIESINKLLTTEFSVFILSTRSSSQIKKWLVEYHSNPLLYMSQSDFFDQYAPMQPIDEKIIKAEYEDNTQLQYKVKIIPFWKKFWNEKGVLGITKRELPAHIYVDDRALRFDGNWNKTLKEIQIVSGLV